MEVKAKYNGTPPTVGDGAWVDLQVDVNGNLKVAGEVASAAIGETDDAKVIDPDAANATVISLLRGILEALNEISTNTAGP